MDKKIFFADLDGTVLNEKKEISPATRAAVDYFMEKGNYLAIATGRSVVSAKKVCRRFGFEWKNMYLATFNGSLIYDTQKDEEIWRFKMDMQDVVDIFAMFKELDIACQTYSDTHIVAYKESDELNHYLSIERDPYVIVDDVRSVLSTEPCKVLGIDVHDPQKNLERIRTLIAERYPGKYYTMYSDRYYLEIMPVGAGKGTGLKELSKILGVGRENTIAAGDHENDITMLEAAGLGVCMKNGVEKAKAAADIITERDNDHDGLCDYIRGFADGSLKAVKLTW